MTESGRGSGEFRHAACRVPVGNIDVGVLIDVATVGSTEAGEGNLVRSYFIIGPLRLMRVIAKEGYWRIVLVENSYSSF